MGQPLVSIHVFGPQASAELQALADTGATFTKVPRSVAESIGLQPRYEARVQLGDGWTITRPLALAEIEIDGIRRPVLVSITQDGEPPLVGYTTLEALGFKVNTVTHALESTSAIEY